MHEFLQDLKFGWRTLTKSPGFTAVALATLAIGIGANTAIFSFVNAVLLAPLPYPEPDRIVRLMEKPPNGGRNLISTLNYLDWERENTVFEFITAAAVGPVTLTGVDLPVQLQGIRVTAHFFDVFGVQAAHGRTFTEQEDDFGRDNVAVISHALWQSQFGGDPDALGRDLQLDGRPHTLIGILPEGSRFDRGRPQIWRPLAFAPENMTRDFHWTWAIARLKPGVTIEQARAEMDTIGARIARDHPDSNKGWGVGIDPWTEAIVSQDLRQSLYLLLAAVGAVLLIGCANLANLMLARGLARDREVAIRAAVGAGRGRLMRQFLTESVLLSGIGGVLGIGVGYTTMKLLQAALPDYRLPPEALVTLDGTVLGFALLLSIITGVVCGLVPALQATNPDLTTGMKQAGGGSSTGRSRALVRSSLVVTEVALAFVLLTFAGLLLQSFARLQEVDPGFHAEHVLTASMPIPQHRFTEPEAMHVYRRQMTDAIGALPGVENVAFTSALPLQGWGYGMPFHRADQAPVDRSRWPACFFKMVTPSYFSAIDLPILRGRGLTAQDVKGSPPVAVISDALRRQYFPDEDPIGKRLEVQEIAFGRTELGQVIAWEIVGIAADENVGNLSNTEGTPGMYVTMEQSPILGFQLIVRTATDPGPLFQPLRAAVNRIDPDQALPAMRTLEQIKTQLLGNSRLITMLLGTFAAIALLLATLGLYGVISYSVVQRTREIGIRAALGASRGDILGLVVRRGMLMVAIGLVAGAIGVIALTQLISVLLFGVGERDPLTIAVVAVILFFVGLVACWLPGRRATKVDPLIALRSE